MSKPIESQEHNLSLRPFTSNAWGNCVQIEARSHPENNLALTRNAAQWLYDGLGYWLESQKGGSA